MSTDLVVHTPAPLVETNKGGNEFDDYLPISVPDYNSYTPRLPIKKKPKKPTLKKPNWAPIRPNRSKKNYEDLRHHDFWTASNEEPFSSSYTNDIEEFIRKVYEYFQNPIPTQDFLIWCWETSLYYIRTEDPDALFWGQSFVRKSDITKYYQIALVSGSGKFTEVDHSFVQVYKVYPPSIKNFEAILSNPGLNYCFKGADRYLRGHFQEKGLFAQIKKFERQYRDSAFDLMHLGVWASFMYMIHPNHVEWRKQNNLIYRYCYEHGECAVIENGIYIPDNYKILNRPANSCVRCGVRSHCVSAYNVNHKSFNTNPSATIGGMKPGVYMMCSRCSEDRPARRCRVAYCGEKSCKHHPSQFL